MASSLQHVRAIFLGLTAGFSLVQTIAARADWTTVPQDNPSWTARVQENKPTPWMTMSILGVGTHAFERSWAETSTRYLCMTSQKDEREANTALGTAEAALKYFSDHANSLPKSFTNWKARKVRKHFQMGIDQAALNLAYAKAVREEYCGRVVNLSSLGIAFSSKLG